MLIVCVIIFTTLVIFALLFYIVCSEEWRSTVSKIARLLLTISLTKDQDKIYI